MLHNKVLYALSDVTVIPTVTSQIRHRASCNVFKGEMGFTHLPIFTAPMLSVVNQYNFEIWEKNHIVPIMPRTEPLDIRHKKSLDGKWSAYSLEEFEKCFCDKQNVPSEHKVVRALIDIANGHIDELPTLIKIAKGLAKDKVYSISIMAGNIANPKTFERLANAGCDYVRCGIGGGSACITSSNTSIHYPMASLLDECRRIKNDYRLECKIIADGGINSYSNAVKALALGADYVMMGSTLAKCFESASPIINETNIVVEDDNRPFDLPNVNINNHLWDDLLSEDAKKTYIKTHHPEKTIVGMSTREAQTAIMVAKGVPVEKIKTKTSEGVTKHLEVSYTVKQWVDNFTDYLKSAMSYCGETDIHSFIGTPEIYILSEGAKNAINK